MTVTHHTRIGDAVLSEFIVSSAYAFLVIMATEQPETLLGEAIFGWIGLTAPIVRIIFAIVPIPEGLNGVPPFEAIGVYRHILAACLLIAYACFVRSRRHWRYWGERISSTLFVAGGQAGSRRRVALFGYRRMLLGLVAAVFLLLFWENRVPALVDYIFAASWTYVRAPLLTTIAYTFACYAVALRFSLIRPRYYRGKPRTDDPQNGSRAS